MAEETSISPSSVTTKDKTHPWFGEVEIDAGYTSVDSSSSEVEIPEVANDKLTEFDMGDSGVDSPHCDMGVVSDKLTKSDTRDNAMNFSNKQENPDFAFQMRIRDVGVNSPNSMENPKIDDKRITRSHTMSTVISSTENDDSVTCTMSDGEDQVTNKDNGSSKQPPNPDNQSRIIQFEPFLDQETSVAEASTNLLSQRSGVSRKGKNLKLARGTKGSSNGQNTRAARGRTCLSSVEPDANPTNVKSSNTEVKSSEVASKKPTPSHSSDTSVSSTTDEKNPDVAHRCKVIKRHLKDTNPNLPTNEEKRDIASGERLTKCSTKDTGVNHDNTKVADSSSKQNANPPSQRGGVRSVPSFDGQTSVIGPSSKLQSHISKEYHEENYSGERLSCTTTNNTNVNSSGSRNENQASCGRSLGPVKSDSANVKASHCKSEAEVKISESTTGVTGVTKLYSEKLTKMCTGPAGFNFHSNAGEIGAGVIAGKVAPDDEHNEMSEPYARKVRLNFHNNTALFIAGEIGGCGEVGKVNHGVVHNEKIISSDTSHKNHTVPSEEENFEFVYSKRLDQSDLNHTCDSFQGNEEDLLVLYRDRLTLSTVNELEDPKIVFGANDPSNWRSNSAHPWLNEDDSDTNNTSAESSSSDVECPEVSDDNLPESATNYTRDNSPRNDENQDGSASGFLSLSPLQQRCLSFPLSVVRSRSRHENVEELNTYESSCPGAKISSSEEDNFKLTAEFNSSLKGIFNSDSHTEGLQSAQPNFDYQTSLVEPSFDHQLQISAHDKKRRNQKVEHHRKVLGLSVGDGKAEGLSNPHSPGRDLRPELSFERLTSSRHREKPHIHRRELLCLGFPNLEQTCYMNSTLQGLLTLTLFVQEVHNQKEVWSRCPNSQIMSGFVKVELCRSSNNEAEKTCVLSAFKEIIAEFNTEFEDDSQKDAHEFLSCVLNSMRSLTFTLQTAAHIMGINYTCPVNAHIAFQMLSTRTCTECGIYSTKEEDYINLSLDLVPGGSVGDFLEEYLKEIQVEYICECGSENSTQRYSFSTFPNVLILQLKRFAYTPFYREDKLDDPVFLSRELEVKLDTENQSTRYSLVSIISHLGSTSHCGHYICDGAQRETSGDLTDNWLTYNDSNVWQTSGSLVCQQRQRTAYLLFYEKASCLTLTPPLFVEEEQ